MGPFVFRWKYYEAFRAPRDQRGGKNERHCHCKTAYMRRAPPTPHPAQLVAGNSGVRLDGPGVVLPGVSS